MYKKTQYLFPERRFLIAVTVAWKTVPLMSDIIPPLFFHDAAIEYTIQRARVFHHQ